MDMDLKQFDEKLNKTFEAFKERQDKAVKEAETRNGEATAETRALVDTINAEITDLRGEIKDIIVRLNRPTFSPESSLTPDQEIEKRAFEKFIRVGPSPDEESTFAYTPEERRALTSASDGTGGFLVPVSYEGGIIMNAYNLAEMRPVCQVGTTGRDTVQLGALSKPTMAWGRAGIVISPQTLTAGARKITVYPLYGLTLIAVDTLDDAEADLETELNDAFGRAVAESEDDAYAAGGGDDSPAGVAANAAVQARYKPSGVADAISDATNNGHDALTDVLYGVKKTYRRNGTWAFNSTTESEIRKLKDGEGRYMWQTSVQADKPPTLLGRPIINPEGMPDVAAGTFPAAFGDFMAGYKIRDNRGMTIQRLVEAYANYDQVGFKIKKRTGGMVVLPEAFCPLKVAAT